MLITEAALREEVRRRRSEESYAWTPASLDWGERIVQKVECGEMSVSDGFTCLSMMEDVCMTPDIRNTQRYHA